MAIKKSQWTALGTLAAIGAAAFMIFSAAHGASEADEDKSKELDGMVRIDGSSTTFPITEAVAEEFQRKHRGKVRVTVGVSGTGGGFKKFTKGETAINDASRPIKEGEWKKAKANNIEFIELPVAYDGIAVVVSKKNEFLENLTMEQLEKLWKPGSKVKTWQDLNKEWPAKEIKLYGPGPASGTFDYFTETVTGKGGASRNDYTASEDDNVLVTGVANDPYALGYFGLAYFEENKDKLGLVGVDAGKGVVKPTAESVGDGTYALARPLFIYVNKKDAKRPEVDAFVNFYLEHAGTLAGQVGYVALPDKKYAKVQKRYKEGKSGSHHTTLN